MLVIHLPKELLSAMMTIATEMRRMTHIFEITGFVALYFVALLFFTYAEVFLANLWYLVVK